MHEQLLALVAKGMEVRDITGEKIGTVGAVYPRIGETSEARSPQRPYAEPAAGSASCIKVDTGLLGLGKSLYIPADFLADVAEFVMVDVQQDQLDQMGWDERPAFLEDS